MVWWRMIIGNSWYDTMNFVIGMGKRKGYAYFAKEVSSNQFIYSSMSTSGHCCFHSELQISSDRQKLIMNDETECVLRCDELRLDWFAGSVVQCVCGVLYTCVHVHMNMMD